MPLAGVRRMDDGEQELDHVNQWGGGCIFLCERGWGLGRKEKDGGLGTYSMLDIALDRTW